VEQELACGGARFGGDVEAAEHARDLFALLFRSEST
jgi:hypothetical protein